ncbi:MAG: glutamate-5-semialdehyde dehydrogenase [Oscillospiraceae bacterium]|jgi:glutamate-5-semialdehyde dehydrogenase|nr:glutamate-5-semialdehyde dehydrogenase [Oscillospiraceae bacterium]
MSDIVRLAQQARAASRALAAAPARARGGALLAVARALEAQAPALLAANAHDMAEAGALDTPLRKRLCFDAAKLAEACAGLRALAALPDPIGTTQRATELAPGLRLYRVACPIGVVGVIFESRPDALVQIAALCLKSGNAALLKGGREALHTNRALFGALYQATLDAGMPSGWAALLETRQDVTEMLALDACIDLIIPRGGNAFVRHIMQNSRIPVLGHADGLCALYVDAAADVDMAVALAVDGKAQYPAVCNATETLLVHREIAPRFLPPLAAAMAQAGVVLRGDARARAIIPCQPAADADFDTEFLDLILAVGVVDTLAEAVAHINAHGSHHTDAIVTRDTEAARAFLAGVDSAGVYHNCSTRFADGYRYGLGAEVGVATGKLHARGPMGLEGLTTYKYKLLGHGQTVGAFASGQAAFAHLSMEEDCPL